MKRASRANATRRQRGLTLIELMMAMFVLAIGLAGGMILVSTAIASNNRNKLDTTATLLSQMVLEKIITPGNNNMPPLVGVPPVQGPPPHFVTVTDCTGATFRVYLDPGGPALNAANPADLDWTQPPPAQGYNMNYTVCRAGGQTSVYDVRWNITAVKGSPAGCQANCTVVYTKLVTVSARPTAAGRNTVQKVLFFGLPVTLRGVVGVLPN